MAARPRVILAGWLGSQPKNLRRYIELYKSLGFDTSYRISPPYFAVKSVFEDNAPLLVPPSWPRTTSKAPVNNLDLAWDVLAEAHYSRSPMLLFHIMSNGGAFLWEQIQRILLSSPENDPLIRPVAATLKSLRQKTVGVVFDSCPGKDLRRIHEAVKHTSPVEQFDILRHCGLILWRSNYNLSLLEPVRERIDPYWSSFRESAWDVPQLYLYAQNDSLAPFDDLNELVEYRMNKFPNVSRKTWIESQHCAHLLVHPDDYRRKIGEFVDRSISLGLRSKI